MDTIMSLLGNKRDICFLHPLAYFNDSCLFHDDLPGLSSCNLEVNITLVALGKYLHRDDIAAKLGHLCLKPLVHFEPYNLPCGFKDEQILLHGETLREIS